MLLCADVLGYALSTLQSIKEYVQRYRRIVFECLDVY